MACAACGGTSEPGKRFCGDCGEPLSTANRDAPADAGPPDGRDGGRVAERRLTTVLFGDLVGFTTLSDGTDPEETRELLSQYFQVANKIVGRFGGTIEKFIGDAVMAVWGAPIAREDDAERAVRAGLDLTAAVAALAEDVGTERLAMRVGVLTGEVAVTLGAVGEGMVAGDAVNTAARIQAAASPGEVWVDETTRSLTAAAITYRNVGEHALKGKAEPLVLHAAEAVVAAVGGAQRIDGLEAPFAGRDRDLRLMKELFHGAIDERRPRLIAVSGPAGVGKTRVSWEFEKYVDGLVETTKWHRGRALSYGEGVTFWPFAEMVRYRLGILDGDSPDDATAKLDTRLAEIVGEPAERSWIRPRLAALLDLDVSGDDAPSSYPRAELFSAWMAFLEHVAEASVGVVCVFDDMQNAESGLLDFIDHLLEAASFPLVIVVMARPELLDRRPGWTTSRRATLLHLEPLPPQAMADIIDGLVDGLPASARSTLVERAEGIPLYAMEMVRSLIDRDAVIPREGRYVLALNADELDLSTAAAPPSLHALTAARLDALDPDERRAVQDASVVGEVFSRDDLEALTVVQDLDRVLAELCRKEIIVLQVDRFSPERGQYRFVQALVRTVAQETLSRRDRKSRHLAVAARLRSRGSDELAAIAARHVLEAIGCAPGDADVADLSREAVALLERAGLRAESLGSPDEAGRLYEQALQLGPAPEVCARLLESASRAAQTDNHADVAVSMATEAGAAYEALGMRAGAGRAAAIAGRALTSLGSVQAAIERMTPAYTELVDGRDDPDTAAAVLALAEELARAHVYLAQPDLALPYANRALQLAESAADWDRVVALLARHSTIWLLNGMPTGGLALIEAAVAVGRAHDCKSALIIPLANLAVELLAQDLPRCLSLAREAVALAEQTGDRDLQRVTSVMLALPQWLAGEWDEIVERFDASSLETEFEQAMLGGVAAQVDIDRGLRTRVPTGPPTDPEQIDDFGARSWVSIQNLQRAIVSGTDDLVDQATTVVRSAVGPLGLGDDSSCLWTLGVEALFAAGDLAGVAAAIALIEKYPETVWPALLRAHVTRARGSLAAAEQRYAQADEQLGAAVIQLGEYGAPFHRAQALLEQARARRAAGGDPADGEALLEEARRVFSQLGAQPWIARVDEVSPVADSRT